MKTMRAAVIENYNQPLQLTELPQPEISATEVLVKIVAASLNPIDLKTQAGQVKFLLHYQMPLILGSDFAGVIQQVGSSVTRFKVGDQVYGRVDKQKIGTFAEYLAVNPADIALKPRNLTFEQAASIPLVGLTSYQALHDLMKIKPGDRILIQAGAGGIGTHAIQLAKLAGAHVTTTTSRKNIPLVTQLGADQIIDYHETDFSEVLHDYDYVFDTLGGENLTKAFQIVQPAGKIISISGLPNERFAKRFGLPSWKQWVLKFAAHKLTRLEKQTGVTYEFLFMQPDGQQLEKLTQLLEAEKIVPVIDRVVPFEQIKAAVAHLQTGHAVGKIILSIDAKLSAEK